MRVFQTVPRRRNYQLAMSTKHSIESFRMSTLKLRQAILKLNRMDIENVDYKYIVSVFRAVAGGVQFYVQRCRGTDLFFRARVHNGAKLTKVSELGAPPPEAVTGFQRCNSPGTSMFYAASKRVTALLECNVQPGDIVYLSQWMCKYETESAPVNTVLSPSMDAKWSDGLSSSSVLFISYLDTIFTRPIHRTFSNQYKLTAAATEFLTTKYPRLPAIAVGEDGTVGLIYPSIANKYDGYNTVFHASFATDRLRILHVMQLRILARDGNNIEVQAINNAFDFPSDEIVWTGDQNAIPKMQVEPGQGLELVWGGREFWIPVHKEPPTPQEVEALMLESFDSPFGSTMVDPSNTFDL